MPGPPPPPPPGGPPPPPMLNMSSVKSAPDNRGALLNSIRQGAKLKKAVTNDRSGPLVGGKTSSNSNTNTTSGGGFTSNTSSSAVPNNLGLGGLFANGMPKLRPTRTDGVRSNETKNNSGFSSLNSSPLRPSNSNGGNSLPNMSASPKTVNNQNDVQSALKKQMASDSNKNRGPPPPAPVRNNISQSIENLQNSTKQPYHSRNNSSNGLHINASVLHKSVGNLQPSPTLSPQIPNSFNNLQINSSTLHRKANSSANLTVFDASDSSLSNSSLPARPSNRKPHLAPKPPTLLNGKVVAPPKKIIMNGKHTNINRTQSMRSPRSPSPQSPEDFPNKFGTVRNMTSALDKSLGHHMNHRTRPMLNGRPSAPPPSIPFQPPSSKIVKPPNHAPPPPPNVIPQPPAHAPPPPPSRTIVQPQAPTRAPPCIPTSANAPPPPPRHSSMRDIPNNNNKRTSPLDLDAKFRSEFHPVSQFPLPGDYRGLHKLYSHNKTVNKQQAPLPPNHIQVNNGMWNNTSSTC